MTGYRCSQLRHDCEEKGCFISALPSWDDLLVAFPRGIRPTDVDGMVEIGGRVLIMEQKNEGVPLPSGQRQAMKVLADTGVVTVLFMRPKGEMLEVLEYPNPQGWQEMTRARFIDRLRAWCQDADANSRPNNTAQERTPCTT